MIGERGEEGWRLKNILAVNDALRVAILEAADELREVETRHVFRERAAVHQQTKQLSTHGQLRHHTETGR